MGGGDGARSGLDGKTIAIGNGAVPACGGWRGEGLGNIEGELELVPGRLEVGEFHCPLDHGVGIHGQLAHHLPGCVVPVEAEFSHLTLQGPCSVSVGAGRLGKRIDDLRAEIEAILMAGIAHSGHADGGMDPSCYHLRQQIMRMGHGRKRG
jgi:hypothetical protein